MQTPIPSFPAPWFSFHLSLENFLRGCPFCPRQAEHSAQTSLFQKSGRCILFSAQAFEREGPLREATLTDDCRDRIEYLSCNRSVGTQIVLGKCHIQSS